MDVVNTTHLPGFGAGAATTELSGIVAISAGVILFPGDWVQTVGG